MAVVEAMGLLRRELERRSELIKRGAYLTKISFGPVQERSFSMRAWWKDGEMSKTFSYSDYYRAAPGSTQPRLVRQPCAIARGIIQEIQSRRGV